MFGRVRASSLIEEFTEDIAAFPNTGFPETEVNSFECFWNALLSTVVAAFPFRIERTDLRLSISGGPRLTFFVNAVAGDRAEHEQEHCAVMD